MSRPLHGMMTITSGYNCNFLPIIIIPEHRQLNADVAISVCALFFQLTLCDVSADSVLV